MAKPIHECFTLNSRKRTLAIHILWLPPGGRLIKIPISLNFLGTMRASPPTLLF